MLSREAPVASIGISIFHVLEMLGKPFSFLAMGFMVVLLASLSVVLWAQCGGGGTLKLPYLELALPKWPRKDRSGSSDSESGDPQAAPAPSPVFIPDDPLFDMIVKYSLNKSEQIRESAKRGKIELTAAAYAPILWDIQKKHKDWMIDAIAAVNREETFWSSQWGKLIGETAHKESRRAFVVSSRVELEQLEAVLTDHARRYKVYVTHFGRLRDPIRDFSIIHQKTVAYYNNENDPIVDKKIVFDKNPEHLAKTILQYDEVIRRSEFYDPDRMDFKSFASKVFERREMSTYIDIAEYHRHEKEHPYYMDMQDRMIAKMRSALAGHSGARVLEIGAGTGLFTEEYLKLPDISVDLVEVDSECCGYLGQLKKTKSKIEKIHNVDICEFTPEGKYKLIVSSFANHHIHESRAAQFYAKVAQLLDPDGYFIVGEEYLPDYDAKDDQARRKALYRYHMHIIAEAIQAGHFEVAELENTSLIQGVKKEGEYKVTLKAAISAMQKAGLKVAEPQRVGPANPDMGGVYFLVAKLES